MKVRFLLLIVTVVFPILAFSQENLDKEDDDSNSVFKNSQLNTQADLLNIDLENDWYFYPVTTSICPGIHIPIGTYSEYFKPSFQFGFSLGIMISKKIRLEYLIAPRFLKNKKQIEIFVNDTVKKTNAPMSGSIGGEVMYGLYKNEHVFIELFSGLAWEPLETELENPNSVNNDDNMIFVSAMGCSFGIKTWINNFEKHNIGVKTFYNIAFYNKDEKLISNIGGQSISVSLIWMFPKRDDAYKKYY